MQELPPTREDAVRDELARRLCERRRFNQALALLNDGLERTALR